MKQTVLAAVVALAIVIFAVQNAGAVNVSFLFWEIRCSMALLLIIMMIAGILGGLMVSGATLRKKNSALKIADKRIAKLERRMSDQAATRKADEK